MDRTMLTIIFGLAASLFWGSGDFNGGLAARRASASSVVVATYVIGCVLLVALALIWREPIPSLADLGWGGLAGLAGVIGLIAFYSALSIGNMGIAAPVSAVLTATIPVLFGIVTQGPPSLLQMGGFALALCAIALISRPQRAKRNPKGLGLALLAGCGFGLFFILISRVSPTAVFWPLAIARIASIIFVLIVVWIRREPALPSRNVTPFVLMAGVLDALGNAFFVLASHSGRLDVATVLSSLYPAATVLLAVIVLKERLSRIQALGVLFALIAVPLISA